MFTFSGCLSALKAGPWIFPTKSITGPRWEPKKRRAEKNTVDLGHGANSWRWSGSPHRSGRPAANVIQWSLLGWNLTMLENTVQWKTSVDSATPEMSVSRRMVMKASNPSSWFDPVDIWSSSSLLTEEFHHSEKVSPTTEDLFQKKT